jgi:ubiquitin carboxyl-terminal hydrolase 25/28
MNKAIEESLQTGAANGTPASYEPLNPEQSIREADTPVGLKNIGNTCYFNSLLQTYFTIPEFYEEIMSFTPPKEEPKQPEAEDKKDDQEDKKYKICVKLILEL